jgi:hypothetical protein
MIELHWITATPVPAADDNCQSDASISCSPSISCSDDRSYQVGAVGLDEGKVTPI